MKKIQLTILLGLVLMFALLGTVSVVGGKSPVGVLFSLFGSSAEPIGNNLSSAGSVLAAHDEANSFETDITFEVNIPAVFNNTVTFNGTSVFDTLSVNTLSAIDLTTDTLIVATKLQAPNVVYSLTGTDGLEITGDQILTIVNTDKGSSQNIFKNFKVGGDTAAAGSNTDTFEFEAGSNIGLSLSDKKLTISNTFTLPTQPWSLTGTSVHLSNTANTVDIASDLTVDGNTVLNGDVTLGGSGTSTVIFNGRLGSGTSLLPSTDLGADLGSSSLRFNNLYVGTINTNSTLSTAGQALFTYEPSDTTYIQASVLINPTSPLANSQLLGIGQGGYQRMLVDAEGDLTIGYNGNISAPASSDPFNVYGHNTTRVASIDASGNMTLAGNLTVGGLSSSFTQGSVIFQGASGLTQDNSNFFWDDTNNRLGIGTTSPQSILNLNGGTNSLATGLTFGNGDTGFYETSATDQIRIALGGLDQATFVANELRSTTTNGGALRFAAGNASFATFTFNGDSDTGMFRATADTLGFTTAGTERVRIDSNGNVGIGTTSPDAKLNLHVPWSSGTLKIMNITTSLPSTVFEMYDNARVGLGNAAANRAGSMTIAGAFSVGGFTNLIGSDHTLLTVAPATGESLGYFGGNRQSALRIDAISEGEVQFTSVRGAGGAWVFAAMTGLRTGNGVGDLVFSTKDVAANTSTTERMRILANGNVGIGTTSPNGKLAVKQTSGSTQNIFDVRGSDDALDFYVDQFGRPVVEGGNMLLRERELHVTGSTFQDRVKLGYTSTGSGTGYGYIDIRNQFNQLRTQLSANGTSYFLDAVGIGTTAPISLLHVDGRVTGKALAIFNETGDQNILTASASGTTRFVITNAGNVGIGTTISPFAPLTVVTNSSGTTTQGIRIQNNAGNTNAGSSLNFGFTTGATDTISAFVTAVRSNAGGGNAGTYLSFGVFNNIGNSNATERMRISELGYLGLGTTAPIAQFEVTRTLSSSIPATGKALAIFNQQESQDIFTASASGTTRFVITNAGNVGIGTSSPTPQLHVVSQGISNSDFIFEDTTSGARLEIKSAGSNNSSLQLTRNTNNWRLGMDVVQADALQFVYNSSEKFRFTNTARLGINNISPQVNLHVGDSSITDGTTLLRLEDANSTCNFTADSGSPLCGSDATLKKDISSLDTVDLLTRISNLKPVSYRWKTQDGNAALQYGFIAQEVEMQFPDLVKTGTWVDGSQRKFLNTGGLMPYVIGAVKEQNTLIKALQSKTSIQAQVNSNGDLTLANRVTALETQTSQHATALSQLQTTISNLFKNAATFLANVTFKGRLLLSPDQTGVATIPAGSTKVKVTFSSQLPVAPVIQLTPRQKLNGTIFIPEVTADYFMIELSEAQTDEMTINWSADLQDSDNNKKPTVEVIEANPSSPTPAPSALPTTSPEPSSSPTPTEPPIATESGGTP